MKALLTLLLISLLALIVLANPPAISRETIERMTYEDMARPANRATIENFFAQFNAQNPLTSPTEKELSALQVLRPNIHRSFITELRSKPGVAITRGTIVLTNVPGFENGRFTFSPTAGIMVRVDGNNRVLHFFNPRNPDQTLGISGNGVEVVTGRESPLTAEYVVIGEARPGVYNTQIRVNSAITIRSREYGMITIYRTADGRSLHYSHAEYRYIYIPAGRFDVRAVGGQPPESNVVVLPSDTSWSLTVTPNQKGTTVFGVNGAAVGRWIDWAKRNAPTPLSREEQDSLFNRN